jgi:NAD(P)-dependent dehydrogenase (short-subunit alcohol dehydrogenase family)
MDLRDRIAIVTGSGGEGCGRAIALRLARDGMRVVVADIRAAGASETARRIESAGGTAAALTCDVRVGSDVEALMAFARASFGGLDVLVNNASAPYRPGAPLEHWPEIVETDLLGPMLATRLAIDAMRERGGGAVVNIGSTSALAHGRTHAGGSPAYDVAKAGIMRLTTMLAWLGARERIRVNCILPDWVATPEVCAYWESITPEQRRKEGAPAQLTPVEGIADAVADLVANESLAGRVLVWWSRDDRPRLVPFGDPGYASLE